MKRVKKEPDGRVNVHDDALMVKLGMQPPTLEPKDPSVWTKTPEERKALRVLRRKHKGKMHFHTIPIKPIPVRAKLIIQLKNNKVFDKSTYSTECYMHQVGEILSKYSNFIIKYSYNGTTYKPYERPFWR